MRTLQIVLGPRWLILLIASGICFATSVADDKQDEAIKKEFARLGGIWTISETRHSGEAIELSEPEEHEIKDTLLIVRKGNRAPITLTLRLDLTTNPKLMDWTTDPKGKFEDADKFAEGIYKLEGDTLTVCYNVKDNKYAKGNRPTEFKSVEGSDAMLIVYKRSKK